MGEQELTLAEIYNLVLEYPEILQDEEVIKILFLVVSHEKRTLLLNRNGIVRLKSTS